MLRRIKLYGSLAKFVGKRVLYAEVESAAEAVRFLVANWPQVRAHMSDRHYRVRVGDQYIKPLTNELHVLAGQETISIVPVVAGAGDVGKSVAQIVIGVALVVASIVIPGSALIFGTMFGALSLSVGVVGAGLILSGTASLLTSTAAVDGPLSTFNGALGSGSGSGSGSGGSGKNTSKDARKSYSFGNVQNVSRQGIAVPVVYGEAVVGSVVVSAGISAVRKKK